MKPLHKVLAVAAAVIASDSARSEIAKAAPAIGGGAWYWLTLNEWVAIATIGYIVLQAAYLARKWWREEKSK